MRYNFEVSICYIYKYILYRPYLVRNDLHIQCLGYSRRITLVFITPIQRLGLKILSEERVNIIIYIYIYINREIMLTIYRLVTLNEVSWSSKINGNFRHNHIAISQQNDFVIPSW